MSDTKISDDLWLKNFDVATKRHIMLFCNNACIDITANYNCTAPDDRLKLLKKIVHVGGFSNKQLILPIVKLLCNYLEINTWPTCVKLSKSLHMKYYP